MGILNPPVYNGVRIVAAHVALEVILSEERINGRANLMPRKLPLDRYARYRRFTCGKEDEQSANKYAIPSWALIETKGVRNAISRR